LLEMGVEFASRDLGNERLSDAELDELIGDRDYKEFLNTRNELYRSRKNEGASALTRRSHQTHVERAESDSQADCAPRIADDSGP
jgi:arsenate reductase-like glutaredoxin family protein